MFIFTFKHTKIRTDFIILKIPRVENTSILRRFTCCLPTILQTLHNIADCRTEHERTSGEGGGGCAIKNSRVGGLLGNTTTKNPMTAFS